MSDYTKITDFGAKDSLISGDPLKIVRGSEIDDEFDAIATAIASKANSSDLTSKVDVAGGTMTGPLILNADATAALGAATKKQMDAGLATKAGTSHTHSWTAITDKGLVEGTTSQDPNTTQSHVILTNHANTPDSGDFWHITTTFYSSLSGNRAQIAVQYSLGNRVYARSYSGTWTAWVRCDLGEGLTRSIGTNGYAKIPGAGGLIFQWGKFTRSGTSHSVTFPMTFPTACLGVTQADMYAAALNDSSRVTAYTASGYTSTRSDGGSMDVLYNAWGY